MIHQGVKGMKNPGPNGRGRVGEFRPPPRPQEDRRTPDDRAIVPYEEDGDAASEASVESVHHEKIKMDSLFEGAPGRGAQAKARAQDKPRGGLDGAAKAKGIPVEDLDDGCDLSELLARIERLDKMTASKLLREYESLGYVADDLLSREELVGLVRDAHIWVELRLLALQVVCANRGLEIDTTQPREELLQLLAESMWEDFGIPVSRFPNVEVARKVLEQVRGLDNCSISELAASCNRWGLPTEAMRGARATPEKLKAQLRQVFIWKALPLPELRRECRSRSLPLPEPEPGALPLAEDAARRQLSDCLVASMLTCTPEMRGIPTGRLESREQAEELVRQVDRLQNMGPLSLKAECYRLNVVHNPAMESQSLVDRLRDVLIWKHLPVQELQQECQRRRIFVLPGDARDVVINSLLEAQDRAVEMAELGVPEQLLGDDEAATDLLEQWKSIEMMSTDDLTQWYEDMSLPLASEVSKKDLQSLMKKAMAWDKLSLEDLRRECSRLGMLAGEDDAPEEEEERQEAQQTAIHRLLLRESIEVLSTEALLAWCGGLGLPSLEGAERASVQRVLRSMLAWEWSPLATLLGECERCGVPVGEAGVQQQEQQQQQVLARRLALHKCLEVMSAEALREWYDSLGLPPGRAMKRPELQGFLRKVLYWQVLSVSELREECARLKLHAGSEGAPEAEAEGDEEGGLQQVLLHRLALGECIETLGKDDLIEWYESNGLPLASGIKRKDLQRLLRAVLAWEALPLEELRRRCADLAGQGAASPCAGTAAHLPEDEQRRSMVQQLALHERVENMTPMDLADWYKTTGLPLEKGTKRSDLQKLLKKVMSWRAMPLMDLQEECEQQGVPIEDLNECDEDEQKDTLVNRLFFDDRMEAWEARGFKAKRIANMENVCQVVQLYTEFEGMDDAQLLRAYVEEGLQEERGMERADCLETLKALLTWQALPLEELLKDCEERCLDVSADCTEEQRGELIAQLVSDLRLKKRPQGPGRYGSRLPRALGQRGLGGGGGEGLGQASPSKPSTRATPRVDIVEPEPEVSRRPRKAAPAAGEAAPPAPGAAPPRAEEAAPPQEDGAAAARASALAAWPRLRDGVSFFINLDRRPDRRKRMEELAAPHAWLGASLQRISAVDGRDLDWKQLVDDQLFTRQAAATAQRAVKEKRATIGSSPLDCSAHLTLGGCGCALSHRKAWEALVQSTSRWALILEDDLTGLCSSFDEELSRVLQLLPADWNMCYLGFHTGRMLEKGTHFRGPIRQLKATDGWLPGLWGYLVSKGCARALLRQAFPMAAQVDTEVGCRATQKAGCFAVPEGEFLLFSPPTESSRDTDVQTFQQDMR